MRGPFHAVLLCGGNQSKAMLAQSCGKTRGQETLSGAIGYRISLSALTSPGTGHSTFVRLRTSSRKEGGGTAGSRPEGEAADPFVITHLLLDRFLAGKSRKRRADFKGAEEFFQGHR
jgi:hypothetical protein